MVAAYRRDGFVRVPGVLSAERAAVYHEAAVTLGERMAARGSQAVFDQYVNAWRHDAVLRDLTLDPRLAALAERLSGCALRLWHDQTLIKQPRSSTPTEFHQDQPYWPHDGGDHALSAWVALCDVPPERGCMTFIRGSHRHTDTAVQDLTDRESLFRLKPELRWEERVTVPLRAGDCTFHHCRTAHAANPNLTDDERVAHVVIYMDAAVRYSPLPHLVTDPLGLEAGQSLDGPLFPPLPSAAEQSRSVRLSWRSSPAGSGSRTPAESRRVTG